MHPSKRAGGLQDRLASRCAEKRHSRQPGCGPKHVRQSKLKELSSKLTCKEKGAHACPQCQDLDSCTVIVYVRAERILLQGYNSEKVVSHTQQAVPTVTDAACLWLVELRAL